MADRSQRWILVVDDDSGQRDLLCTFLGRNGFHTASAASANAAMQAVSEAVPDLVVSDVRMQGRSGLELMSDLRRLHPTLPVLLVTAYADIRDAVGAMRDGAVSYLEKPIDLQELLACVRKALGGPGTAIAVSCDIPPLPDGVIAASPAMLEVLRQAALVAPTDSRVLLTGESGTGKEVVARLIHAWSRRAEKAMVQLNCAAIPENLLESELFGHERGAFTGAHKQRRGRFEEADGGTLFLDEIAELAPALQAKLLRVIQDGVLERVGSNEPRKVDVRVIAATNRNLEEEVETGRFREDLFYRLSVIELYLSPLRERPEDVLPLAEFFAGRHVEGGVRLSAQVVNLLSLYTWPGNVRELQNAMERATLMARGAMVLPDHLPRRVQEAAPRVQEPKGGAETEGGRMEQMERMLILQTLREHDFNRTETARALGIGRRTLTYKLRALRELGCPVDPA